MVRIGRDISYRQLCLLSIFSKTERFDLRKESYRGIKSLGEKRISLLQEIADLDAQGLLNCSGDALLGLSDVNPSKMKIQGTGAMLYNLMELWEIDDGNFESIIMLLKNIPINPSFCVNPILCISFLAHFLAKFGVIRNPLKSDIIIGQDQYLATVQDVNMVIDGGEEL
jgi:hypothetical protein